MDQIVLAQLIADNGSTLDIAIGSKEHVDAAFKHFQYTEGFPSGEVKYIPVTEERFNTEHSCYDLSREEFIKYITSPYPSH
jgi:hypothetical protein